MLHKILTTFSIFLASILLMSLLPHMSAASIVCVIFLTAGGAVVYHEVSALTDVDAPRRAPAAPMPQTVPQPVAAAWDLGVVDRRAENIHLRPSDSVEQIARIMVSTSFHQASQKYHPDHGGSDDMMRRIIQARYLLLTAFRRY